MTHGRLFISTVLLYFKVWTRLNNLHGQMLSTLGV